jgi:Ethanolamine utilization protein, possible chaperonin protecting lyase from inhibition
LETFLSAGIDIGTTTTEVVFSRLAVENTGGAAPKIEIVKKEIIYKSPIFFTPLLSQDEIDGKAVFEIIRKEYAAAGLKPEDVSTGALIVTGETALKKNAREISALAASLAGDFVVAAAGADFEAALAGKGSGAAALSFESGKKVLNMDVGGGTTNMALFEDGALADTGNYYIGGRHIKVSGGKVYYISDKMQALLARSGIDLKIGDELKSETAGRIAALLCWALEEAAGLTPASELSDMLVVDHGLAKRLEPDIFTFSGGVAECVNNAYPDFAFGDLGVFLGRAIAKTRFFWRGKTVKRTAETIRATVIGAGNFSTVLSGSTVEYRGVTFPVKDVPSARLNFYCGTDGLEEKAREAAARFESLPAICFRGPENPSFGEIRDAARALSNATKGREGLPIFISETDIAKALGQEFGRIDKRPFLFVDSVFASDGDFVGFGKPVAGGKALPVTVKTLIFDREQGAGSGKDKY